MAKTHIEPVPIWKQVEQHIQNSTNFIPKHGVIHVDATPANGHLLGFSTNGFSKLGTMQFFYLFEDNIRMLTYNDNKEIVMQVIYEDNIDIADFEECSASYTRGPSTIWYKNNKIQKVIYQCGEYNGWNLLDTIPSEIISGKLCVPAIIKCIKSSYQITSVSEVRDPSTEQLAIITAMFSQPVYYS